MSTDSSPRVRIVRIPRDVPENLKAYSAWCAELEAATATDHFRVVLDFRELDYPRSLVIGAVMGAVLRGRELGGSLCAFGIGPFVRKYLEMGNVAMPFPVFDSEEAAVRALEEDDKRTG